MAVDLVSVPIRVFVETCSNQIYIFELSHAVNHLIDPDKKTDFQEGCSVLRELRARTCYKIHNKYRVLISYVN